MVTEPATDSNWDFTRQQWTWEGFNRTDTFSVAGDFTSTKKQHQEGLPYLDAAGVLKEAEERFGDVNRTLDAKLPVGVATNKVGANIHFELAEDQNDIRYSQPPN